MSRMDELMTYTEIFRKLKLINKHFASIPYLNTELGDLEDMISEAHNITNDALEIVRDLVKMEEK